MMSRFLKTPKTRSANVGGGGVRRCGASGRLRAEGVSGERGAAERGGASDQLRARGRGGAAASSGHSCPMRYPAVSAAVSGDGLGGGISGARRATRATPGIATLVFARTRGAAR